MLSLVVSQHIYFPCNLTAYTYGMTVITQTGRFLLCVQCPYAACYDMPVPCSSLLFIQNFTSFHQPTKSVQLEQSILISNHVECCCYRLIPLSDRGLQGSGVKVKEM